MELIVEQLKFKYNYEYRVYDMGIHIYTAKINRTIIPSLRKICLYETNGREICCLKQENWLKIILGMIPVINGFNFSICSYIYYKNGINEGYLSEKVTVLSEYVMGTIYGNNYEMWEHTGNNIGIYCNEKQVALIKRASFKEYDGNQYEILYNKNFEKEIVVIFCLLADVLWATSDTTSYTLSWEYTVQLTGKKMDKTWKPED
ncbi:hypothetical protein ACFIJ5_16205 [Haloimpatiens sp. FM7330]|uniref:hypothetical protein n=1 Tax=Haloimpatiens sp. FM7330 TaxID=3298610 RepID=UPI00363747D0